MLSLARCRSSVSGTVVAGPKTGHRVVRASTKSVTKPGSFSHPPTEFCVKFQFGFVAVTQALLFTNYCHLDAHAGLHSDTEFDLVILDVGRSSIRSIPSARIVHMIHPFSAEPLRAAR